jgi:hypothetical protein
LGAQSRPDSPGPRHRFAVGTYALAMTVLTGGCGFMSAPTNPPTPSAALSGPTSSNAATPAAPVTPVGTAAADLASSLDGRAASLAVSVDSVTRGVPPVPTVDGLLTQDCGLAPDTTEYVPVSVVFTGRGLPTKETGVSSNLRLDLTLAGGDGLGLIAAYANPTDYCDDASVLPSQTALQSQNLADEHQTMTVYVVARTSPTEAEPLRGVTLQLRDPRHHPDAIDAGAWTWDVQQVTAGSACPGDPNSLCVPLG